MAEIIQALLSIADAIRANFRPTIDITRDNNGSFVQAPGSRIVAGWRGATFGGAVSNMIFSVTFDKPFTEIPIVNTTYGGDQPSGSVALGSGANSVKLFAGAKAVNVTTTGFTLYIFSTDGTLFAAGNSAYAHYTAIGR